MQQKVVGQQFFIRQINDRAVKFGLFLHDWVLASDILEFQNLLITLLFYLSVEVTVSPVLCVGFL